MKVSNLSNLVQHGPNRYPQFQPYLSILQSKPQTFPAYSAEGPVPCTLSPIADISFNVTYPFISPARNPGFFLLSQHPPFVNLFNLLRVPLT